jgi:nitroreductase
MVMSLIQKRRSIRKFKANPVEPEKLDMLVEAALRAPSSRGLQPWEFVVVTDKDLLERLSRAKSYGSAFLGNAPLGIVVYADPTTADTWIEDTSIAATYIQLVAESLGLGSCWIQIRDRRHDDKVSAEDYVAEILHLPKGRKVEAIVAVGYPDEEKRPHSRENLPFEKVHLGIYGKPYTE